MNCRDVRRLIPAYMDGLIDHEESFEIRQHINACSGCREYLRTYEHDAQALSQHLRRAPFAPVARSVIDQIDQRRSPWWDAFWAGSYRLASVAGLVLVILVVGVGAWALREVATSDDEPSTPETMIGVHDQDDEPMTAEVDTPMLISADEVEVIVDQLDEAGLVFDADVVSEGDGYSVEYGRVAFDRHLMFLEYRITELDDGARLMIGAFADGGGGGADFSDGDLPSEGWLTLPAVDREAEDVSLQDGVTLGDAAQNAHQIPVDLSKIPEEDEYRETYQVGDAANGIELCCLQVERGVAVSTVRYKSEIVDEDALIYVDESLNPVDSPPMLDAIVEPVLPTVTVNGEELPVLEPEVAQALILEGEGVGVVGLPREGALEVHYEHLMLQVVGDNPTPAIYQGPWTLSAQLEDHDAEVEPTPEPTPPPDVAQEITPTPEPTPVPADDDVEGDRLRVMVYLIRGEEIGAASREVEHTQQVATAAMNELLQGVTSEDEDAGLHSEIPEGTEMLDIALRDSTVTIDLSEEFFSGGGSLSMQLRVAQVVHTLTQFESIDSVEFLVEGQPVDGVGGQGIVIDEPLDREDFEDVAPAILIETPAPGETVTSHFRLVGTANTFEANLQIEVIDPDGEQIYRDYGSASSGTGTRGEFNMTIPVEIETEGWGSIRMFEHSARDGSRVNVVTIPVWFEVE